MESMTLILPHHASLQGYLNCRKGVRSYRTVSKRRVHVCAAHLQRAGFKGFSRERVVWPTCRTNTRVKEAELRWHGERAHKLRFSDSSYFKTAQIEAKEVSEGNCSPLQLVDEPCPNRTHSSISRDLAHSSPTSSSDRNGEIELPMAAWALLASLLPLAYADAANAAAEVATATLSPGTDFQNGLASAFLLIFFSEIGDKTFFIAALLATRQNNFAVFGGTFGALALMTVISVGLGRFFHYLDEFLPFNSGDNPLPLDDIAAVVLLVYFGVTTLLDASTMDGSKTADEQQEAELAIAGLGTDGSGVAALAGTAAATFALVFVAEWGDKSFFSTIALAAASSPLGVVSGAVVGHGVATLIAVLGGSFIGSSVSEKVVAYIGGILFLVFAGVTVGEIFTNYGVF